MLNVFCGCKGEVKVENTLISDHLICSKIHGGIFDKSDWEEAEHTSTEGDLYYKYFSCGTKLNRIWVTVDNSMKIKYIEITSDSNLWSYQDRHSVLARCIMSYGGDFIVKSQKTNESNIVSFDWNKNKIYVNLAFVQYDSDIWNVAVYVSDLSTKR